MKKLSLALVAALLLCLTAGSALAELVVDLAGKDHCGKIRIDENATVTGSAAGVSLVVDASVTELTLRDVIITSSNADALRFNGGDGDTLTLILEGDNKLESSSWYSIKASTSNLIITGSGTLEAIGANLDHQGGYGIYVGGTLEITGTGSVTATGGAGTKIKGQYSGWGGTGLCAHKLEISGTGSVTATGGNGDTFGGMGIDIQSVGGLSIANGSTVTVTAGEGPNRCPALQTFGNILVDSSTLTVNALRSDGINFRVPGKNGSAGKLIVSGDSHVTVNSGSGAATSEPEFRSDVDDYIPAQIELNGDFVMRAGADKSSAAEMNVYDQKYPYLSIEPVQPAVPNDPILPPTGDAAPLTLLTALAAISLAALLILRRRTA